MINIACWLPITHLLKASSHELEDHEHREVWRVGDDQSSDK